jgi:benzil reductase ((S)-benzoin forming)
MNILITGTGKGLGGALAEYYLERGHTVYGINRSRNEELENYPAFRFLLQDLSKFQEMEQTVPRFIGKGTGLDLVVLNAGVLSQIQDLKDTGIDEIREVMDINVWANKLLIDLLFSVTGRVKQIAAVSSGASVYGNRGWNAYSISKAALNMLIRLYSGEQPDTHFSSIAPGLIDTAMQDYIYSLPDDPRFPSIKRLKETRASGNMPGPAEAAGILASALEKALSEESGSYLDVREMQ